LNSRVRRKRDAARNPHYPIAPMGLDGKPLIPYAAKGIDASIAVA
jgi:hypothetical protein